MNGKTKDMVWIVSIGLSFIMVIGGGFAAGAKIQAAVLNNREDLMEQKRVDEKHEERIRKVEESVIAQRTDIGYIKTGMGEVKGLLQELVRAR